MRPVLSKISPRSISWYLMLLLITAIVPVLFSTYLSVKRADSLQSHTSIQAQKRARIDIKRVLHTYSKQLTSIARRLSQWDETRTLFFDATYYRYWKQTRVSELSSHRGMIDAIELYNNKGKALVGEVSLSNKVDKKALKAPSIQRLGKNIFLVYFHAVTKTSQPSSKIIGYIGLRINVNKMFKAYGVLKQYSIEKLQWTSPDQQTVPLSLAISKIVILVFESTEVRELVGLVRNSIWGYMTYMFVLISVSGILFTVLIAKPLSRLAAHLRTDDSGSVDRVPNSISGPLKIAELENVTHALNEYKDRLQSAVVTLEQTNKELMHLTFHDPLTGCANRRAFERRLKHAMQAVELGIQKYALCYLDVDQFKVVNDTCGHIAGDELLKQIASLLEGEINKADLLARLGGDEFGVLFENCQFDTAIEIAERMREKIMGHRFVWHGQTYVITISIGLVPISRETPNMSEVLKNADAACYVAKDSGRNRLHIYQENDQELAQRHGEMQWVGRIKQALEEGRFELYGQLIKPLHKESETIYCEVLLRLIEHDGKLVLPMAFIPAAERYNLMSQIDQWVIKQSMRLLGEANCLNESREVVLSINLSGQSLGDKEIFECIKDSIEEFGAKPSNICFEITETAAIANLNQAVIFIEYLRDLGCHFALDDFGSGLSSFGYITNLELDSIKIDGYFIKNILTDPLSRTIIKAINEIGHVLGITTIAEFAEDDAIIAELKKLNVDFGQGLGIHKPEPLVQLLQSGPSFLVSNLGR